jgi:hypothetical protein
LTWGGGGEAAWGEALRFWNEFDLAVGAVARAWELTGDEVVGDQVSGEHGYLPRGEGSSGRRRRMRRIGGASVSTLRWSEF